MSKDMLGDVVRKLAGVSTDTEVLGFVSDLLEKLKSPEWFSATKRFLRLPWSVTVLALVSDLFCKLQNPEWVEALKKFLRKEDPWFVLTPSEEVGRLVLPKDENLIGLLRKKLEEYKGRVVENSSFNAVDAKHKVFVLEHLLEFGEIDPSGIVSILEQEKWFTKMDFKNAVHVIHAYCTGSMRVTFWPPSPK